MKPTICLLVNSEFSNTRRVRKEYLRDLLLEVLGSAAIKVTASSIETATGRIVFDSSEPDGHGGRGMEHVYITEPLRG